MSDRATDPIPVRLTPAFAFECPRCGAANYIRAQHAAPEDVPDAPEHFEGDFLVAPAQAECKDCKAILTLEDA